MTEEKQLDSHPKNPPFKPSWVNQLTIWLDHLPIHPAIIYLVVFIMTTIMLHLAPWIEGQILFPKIAVDIAIVNIWMFIAIGIMHYLDNFARQAILSFREAIEVDDEEFNTLRYEISHMRSFWVWVFTGIGLVGVIVTIRYFPEFFGELVITLVSQILYFILFGIGYSTLLILIYHTLRQLRVMTKVYSYVEDINVFWLDPLYGLAGLSMRTGVAFILLLNFNFLLNVILLEEEISSILVVFFTFIYTTAALLTFVLPLWGIRRKIEAAKEDNLRNTNARIQAAMHELHKIMDNSDRSGIEDLKNGIQGLFTYRKELENISSWPWQRSTLRGFLSTIFLPILIWLLQEFLSKFV